VRKWEEEDSQLSTEETGEKVIVQPPPLSLISQLNFHHPTKVKEKAVFFYYFPFTCIIVSRVWLHPK
jgi:hypothetical protein